MGRTAKRMRRVRFVKNVTFTETQSNVFIYVTAISGRELQFAAVVPKIVCTISCDFVPLMSLFLGCLSTGVVAEAISPSS